jgi:hypothetical protein
VTLRWRRGGRRRSSRGERAGAERAARGGVGGFAANPTASSAMLRTSLLPVPPPRAREHIDVATLPLPLDVMSLVLPLLPFQVCHPLRTYSLTRLPGVPPPSYLLTHSASAAGDVRVAGRALGSAQLVRIYGGDGAGSGGTGLHQPCTRPPHPRQPAVAATLGPRLHRRQTNLSRAATLNDSQLEVALSKQLAAAATPAGAAASPACAAPTGANNSPVRFGSTRYAPGFARIAAMGGGE